MNRQMIVIMACLAMATAWGKSFSIDLRQSVKRADLRAMANFKQVSAINGDSEFLRKVNLDAGSADVGLVSVGDELTFTLFDDVVLTLTLKEQMPSPLGGDVFVAEVSGYGGVKNAVVLRTEDGLTVDIYDYLRKKVYKVVSTAMGVAVQEMEIKEGRGGCDVRKPSSLPMASTLRKAAKVEKSANTVSNEVVCVDILVAFDRDATTWANANGGGITNFAQMSVQKMNTVLANNGLDRNFRFRLVGVMRVSVATDDLDFALEAVTFGMGGWSSIKAMRNEVGADVVTVLVDTGTDVGCVGISWGLDTTDIESFSEFAYNTCAIRSVAWSHTMTHEVGHALGCGHSDVQMEDPGPQLYRYSSGYYFRAEGDKYHTVMAYDGDGPGGIEVPYFSSPRHSYKGVVVGDEQHDNCMTIANTYRAVSLWRDTKGIEIGGESGGREDEEPVIDDSSDGDAQIKDATFSKAQTVDGMLYGTDGGFAGTVQLKAGKLNKKKGTVSISASATLLDGKKITGKAVTVKLNVDGTASGTVKFKAPIGDMKFKMEMGGTFTFDNGSYLMTEGAVGGNLPGGTMVFCADLDGIPALEAEYDIIDDALPLNQTATVSGGKKIDFGKVATIKYKKFKEDGETRYELDGLDGDLKPNLSGLKLTYTPKTGMFKGSFKIYATNAESIAEGKKPTLKKYTVNVTGFIIDEGAGLVGVGQATLKKPAASWSVTLEFE